VLELELVQGSKVLEQVAGKPDRKKVSCNNLAILVGTHMRPP